jgi:hypothetical protein
LSQTGTNTLIEAQSGDGTELMVLPTFVAPALPDGAVPVMDTTPGYTDTQPFPAAKTVWTYRGIYLLNDGRVGVWSQNVSIAVQA